MSHSLVVDLGGTYTRFAIMGPHNDIHYQESYINNQFQSFEEVLTTYLNQYPQQVKNATQCCIAVAGPVKNNQAKLTNLDWVLDANKLRTNLPFSRLELINDFYSLGFSVPFLNNDSVIALQPGTPNPNSLKVIVGAGTGLGVALVQADKNNLRVFPSEGGHIDFAPINSRQERLSKFLQQKYTHLSVEHVLSGHGLENIFEFICKEENKHAAEITFNHNEHTCSNIAGRKIIQLANEENHPTAIATLRLFCEIYAAYLGNLALLTLPYGGIYITGGIAKHILPYLQEDSFLQTMQAKGRLSTLLHHIPIYYIINKNVNLLGAGFYLVAR